LEKPGNGDYVDTWNIPVNADMSAIDAAFGNVTSLNATSGSAILSSANYTNMALNITGAMTANVTYTIPSGVGGSWIVRNATTDGSGGPWYVTIASAGGGDSVNVIRGRNVAVWSDGTNIRVVQPNVVSTGTVTSVDVSGGTTGLTTSGGPITTNGTITIGGTLAANSGGTGLSSFTANNAIYSNSNSTLTAGTLPIPAGGTGLTALGTGVQSALSANVTGSDSIVLQTSPNITTPTVSGGTMSNVTLITPALGTPTSGNLINTTSVPVANATGVLSVVNGGTGANTLTANSLVVGNGNSAVTLLAPGTSGNVVTSNGTAWTSAAPNSSSFTLLGSLSGTGATTRVLSNLTLTPYKQLYCVFSGISSTTDTDTIWVMDSGATLGQLPKSAENTSGHTAIDLTVGTYTCVLSRSVSDSQASSANSTENFSFWVGRANVTTASTSVTFGIAGGGNFDAGTIYVYGVK